jgi:hypothetical protein
MISTYTKTGKPGSGPSRIPGELVANGEVKAKYLMI